MKSELIDVSPTRKEIKVMVEPEALKAAYAKASQKYARSATVPGFRKGFAPADVVRIRFQEEIKNEVLRDVVPERITAAIEEHNLQPLTEPHLHIENVETLKVNGSEEIWVHAHVEVMPEVGRPVYEGLEAERMIRPVAEPELESLIEDRLKGHSALIPVEDRASEEGDTVIADLEGRFDDDPEGEPITADNLEIVLGSGDIEPAFTDNLLGVKPDDEKEFSVSYPADFSSSALAGRTVHYKAKINSVGRTELPELNDEWAKSLDEGYESLADLRSRLRGNLELYAKADADARVRNDLIAKLIESNPVEIPATLIENQARNLLNNFAHDLHQRGVDLNRVQSDFVNSAFEQMKVQAERDVRGAILLEKIAEEEKVDVTQAEFDDEIVKLAEQYRMSPEEFREMLQKQGGENVVWNNLRTRKSIEALVAKAKVVDKEWAEEPGAGAEQEKASDKKGKESKAAAAKAPKKKSAKPKA
ncbi:MAG: trigger factor [Chloracidobacterium sp.]|nr:trigger factor [Chloracidobacterium sp.]